MDSTADRQRPILIESFALELNIERSLVAAAVPWITGSKNRFCVRGEYSEIFKFVTAIYGIAIREADVSGGGLPEVHHLGFVVVDC